MAVSLEGIKIIQPFHFVRNTHMYAGLHIADSLLINGEHCFLYDFSSVKGQLEWFDHLRGTDVFTSNCCMNLNVFS